MRRLLLIAVAMAAGHAAAADTPIGRLFFTPAERAALEDARRRNIRAEELAAEAAKRPAAPRARSVTVTGVVLRSDGESFAWVNGKSVEGRTSDGLRVRHTAQPNRVVVYDPDKGRMVQVKVGQRADLTTGRVEENYERRKRVSAEAIEPAPAMDAQTQPGAQPEGRPGKRRAAGEAGDADTEDADDSARVDPASP